MGIVPQQGPGRTAFWRLLGFSTALVAGVLILGLLPPPQARSAVAAPIPHSEPLAVPVRLPVSEAGAGTAAPGGPGAGPPPRTAEAPQATAHEFTVEDYFVHVPHGVSDPAPVLVALHGMGGTGPGACDGVRTWADREGWVLVGPTFAYGDWTNPEQVAREGPYYLPRLAQILDELPDRIGHPIEPQVALYGFSRGAQLAGRFALLYPERVKAAVLLSAGTYTLPLAEAAVDSIPRALPYPFGIADLAERFGRVLDLPAVRHVPFWIAVGTEDNDPTAVPAQWSPFLGASRLERARRFAAMLQSLQVPVQETEFPGLGHEIGDAERDEALAWVRSQR